MRTGHAMLVGSKYYITFDKRYYDFEGRCTYLLAKDFVDRNFTLLVSYNGNRHIEELLLLLNNTVVRINMQTDGIQIGDSDVEYLPAQIGEAFLYRNEGVFYVTSEMGFALECNMKFKICSFQMSGWYSGKTAGLWGTYNNEPSDDFLMSNKAKAQRSRVDTFGDSWSLQEDCKAGPQSPPRTSNKVPKEVRAACEEFFTSKVSQLSACFSRIPKESFLYMCLNSTTLDEACSSAVSYISLCALENTPLRIPDTCVKCNLPNGTEIQEGDFIRLQGSSVPQTADIVFIVEAKDCNKDVKNARNLDVVVELLEKELAELNITDNRYAVVTFGGDGVYDQPRSIIVGGQIFADAKSVPKYFGNIPAALGAKEYQATILKITPLPHKCAHITSNNGVSYIEISITAPGSSSVKQKVFENTDNSEAPHSELDCAASEGNCHNSE
nr:unnamed protein product [Callosobruchus chinensis]